MCFRRTIALLFLSGTCTIASDVPAQPQAPAPIVSKQDLVIHGEKVRVVQHEGGAVCVVCRKEIHAQDPIYLIGGQRVAVHGPGSPCDVAFRSDPEKFLATLQPRGAFLGGKPSEQAGIGWFLFGAYVLTGLIFAGLCGQLALEHGHPTLGWYLAGFFLNVVAYGVLRAKRAGAVQAPAGVPGGLGKISATYDPVLCTCGAENHPSARQCSTCGRELKPQVNSEVARSGLS